jgi:hypothetical protein
VEEVLPILVRVRDEGTVILTLTVLVQMLESRENAGRPYDMPT